MRGATPKDRVLIDLHHGALTLRSHSNDCSEVMGAYGKLRYREEPPNLYDAASESSELRDGRVMSTLIVRHGTAS